MSCYLILCIYTLIIIICVYLVIYMSRYGPSKETSKISIRMKWTEWNPFENIRISVCVWTSLCVKLGYQMNNKYVVDTDCMFVYVNLCVSKFWDYRYFLSIIRHVSKMNHLISNKYCDFVLILIYGELKVCL